MPAGKLSFIGFVLLCAPYATAQSRVEGPHSTSIPSLSASWYGTWAGKLTVVGPDGSSFEKGMTLTIRPEEGSSSYRWRMTSDLGGRTTVRDYRLVPRADAPGRFVIDEGDIILDVRLAGNTLYTYYLDGDILINTRYELRDAGMHVELASVETADARVSTLPEFEVHSYMLGGLQSGVLQKQSE